MAEIGITPEPKDILHNSHNLNFLYSPVASVSPQFENDILGFDRL